jgi:hypothetical protein
MPCSSHEENINFAAAGAELVGRPDEVNDYRHIKKGDAKINGVLDKKISRRRLLKGAAVVTGAALASAFVGRARAAKSTKAAVKYQDKPKGDQKCSDCKFFVPGKTPTADGTCQVVEGSISPQGWCTAYTKKS